jgi:hypothetical protein
MYYIITPITLPLHPLPHCHQTWPCRR